MKRICVGDVCCEELRQRGLLCGFAAARPDEEDLQRESCCEELQRSSGAQRAP